MVDCDGVGDQDILGEDDLTGARGSIAVVDSVLQFFLVVYVDGVGSCSHVEWEEEVRKEVRGHEIGIDRKELRAT